jgi:hypothetical protein
MVFKDRIPGNNPSHLDPTTNALTQLAADMYTSSDSVTYQGNSPFSYINNSETDTVCAVFVDSIGNVTIAFRGTQSWTNISTDGKMNLVDGASIGLPGINVHAGFRNAYESIRDELHDVLDSIKGFENVKITGHSLGGSLAQLATMDLTAADIVDGTAIQTTTFGAAQIGDKSTQEWYNANSEDVILHNLVAQGDPIPTLIADVNASLWGEQEYVSISPQKIGEKSQQDTTFQSGISYLMDFLPMAVINRLSEAHSMQNYLMAADISQEMDYSGVEEVLDSANLTEQQKQEADTVLGINTGHSVEIGEKDPVSHASPPPSPPHPSGSDESESTEDPVPPQPSGSDESESTEFENPEPATGREEDEEDEEDKEEEGGGGGGGGGGGNPTFTTSGKDPPLQNVKNEDEGIGVSVSLIKGRILPSFANGEKQNGGQRYSLKNEAQEVKTYEGPSHDKSTTTIFGKWTGAAPYANALPLKNSALDSFSMDYLISVHENGYHHEMARKLYIKRIKVAIQENTLSEGKELNAAKTILASFKKDGHIFNSKGRQKDFVTDMAEKAGFGAFLNTQSALHSEVASDPPLNFTMNESRKRNLNTFLGSSEGESLYTDLVGTISKRVAYHNSNPAFVFANHGIENMDIAIKILEHVGEKGRFHLNFLKEQLIYADAGNSAAIEVMKHYSTHAKNNPGINKNFLPGPFAKRMLTVSTKKSKRNEEMVSYQMRGIEKTKLVKNKLKNMIPR